MVSKLFITVCVLFLVMECLVESHKIPTENQSVLHRQKRSKEIIDKIKKFVVTSVGGASETSPDHTTDSEKDSEASGTSHFFSSKSKGKGDEKHSTKSHYDGSDHFGHTEEHFDASKLLKSTLYTLFETFKAIGGAATAISGKLIKVSGYGVSYGGKLIAASGDPITSLGKKIALKAMLLNPEKLHLHDDFSSHTPNELVEFNHPHDTTGFLPESPISHYGPLLNEGFDNQFADIHEPFFQYGPQLPISYLHKRKSKAK